MLIKLHINLTMCHLSKNKVVKSFILQNNNKLLYKVRDTVDFQVF